MSTRKTLREGDMPHHINEESILDKPDGIVDE